MFRKISILIIFLFFGSNLSAQEDPSKWPKPSWEQIQNGFYTKERLLKYYHWLLQWELDNLPEIFILFEEDKERKLVAYQYAGGWNYELHFNYTPNLVFYTHNRPDHEELNIYEISYDSLSKLDVKDRDWLSKHFLDNDIEKNRCNHLDRISSSVFIVMSNPNGSGYLVMKPVACLEEFQ